MLFILQTAHTKSDSRLPEVPKSEQTPLLHAYSIAFFFKARFLDRTEIPHENLHTAIQEVTSLFLKGNYGRDLGSHRKNPQTGLPGIATEPVELTDIMFRASEENFFSSRLLRIHKNLKLLSLKDFATTMKDAVKDRESEWKKDREGLDQEELDAREKALLREGLNTAFINYRDTELQKALFIDRDTQIVDLSAYFRSTVTLPVARYINYLEQFASEERFDKPLYNALVHATQYLYMSERINTHLRQNVSEGDKSTVLALVEMYNHAAILNFSNLYKLLNRSPEPALS